MAGSYQKGKRRVLFQEAINARWNDVVHAANVLQKRKKCAIPNLEMEDISKSTDQLNPGDLTDRCHFINAGYPVH